MGRPGLQLLAAIAVAAAVVTIGRRLPFGLLLALTAALTILPGIVAAVRRQSGAAAALVTGLAAAPLLMVPLWIATHPVLHVDNALGVPIDVWIDGRRWKTLPPTPDTGEPPHLRLPFGSHHLAWTAPGAKTPMHEVDLSLGLSGEHLYSPNAAGCYWLAATAYGGASTHGVPHGPQPIGEIVRLDRVDLWFVDAPSKVRAPWFARSSLRIALQRNRSCMELAARGCDAAQRDAFVDCSRSIDGRVAAPDCFGDALRGCKKPPSSPPSSPAKTLVP